MLLSFLIAQSMAAALAVPATDEVLVVTATRQLGRAADVPAAIDVVSAANIRNGQAQINLSESLVRVPGLYIANRQNYAQDLQISSRGFGARASFGVRGIRLVVDDLPATFPDGQGQGAVLPLSSLQRIEVLRGPWAVAYGNASGGVIHAITEAAGAEPGVTASFLSGDNKQERIGLRASIAGESASYLVDLNRFSTAGYREHSRTTREQSYAKAAFSFDAGQTLTLSAGTLRQPETQDPLGLTQSEFDADARQAGSVAKAFNTRKSISQQQGGAVLTAAWRGMDVKLIGYGGVREVEQFLAIPVAAQTAATSAGGVIDLKRRFSGVGLQLGQVRNAWQWVAGIELDSSNEVRRGFNNFSDDAAARVGVAGRLRRDEENRAASHDVFAQATWRVAEHVNVQAGVRASKLIFRSRDAYIAPGNGDDSGALDFRSVSPALGVSWRASTNLNVYASAARGFESPTLVELAYRSDGAGGLNLDLKPGTSRNLEVGAKWRGANAAHLDAALFHVATDAEIVPAASAGGRTTFQNAGRTVRRGAELGGGARLPAAFTANVALTWIDARLRDGFVSTSTQGSVTTARDVSAGNALPGVPRFTAFAELVWREGRPGFSTALEVVHRSRMAADDRNTAYADAFTVLNWRLMHSAKLAAFSIDSFLRIDNLADRKYAGSVIVNESNARYFESAPQRTLFVGVRLHHAFR